MISGDISDFLGDSRLTLGILVLFIFAEFIYFFMYFYLYFPLSCLSPKFLHNQSINVNRELLRQYAMIRYDLVTCPSFVLFEWTQFVKLSFSCF